MGTYVVLTQFSYHKISETIHKSTLYTYMYGGKLLEGHSLLYSGGALCVYDN